MREIVKMLEVTRVPGTHPAVLGVVNLRGRIVPVADLLAAVSGEPARHERRSDRSCIVILDNPSDPDDTVVGLAVDDVLDVAEIPTAEVQRPDFPSAAGTASTVRGLARVDAGVVAVLDTARLLRAAGLAEASARDTMEADS